MPYRPFEDQNCSIARALSVVGERWTLLVVRELMLGRRRFEDIRRNTGIASNILVDRLQTLVDNGVVERRASSDHPDSHEYRLTHVGLDLQTVVVGLMRWGDRHFRAGEGPPRVLVHTTCQHDTEPRLMCSHCDEPIGPGDVRVRPGVGANARQRAEGVLP
jgi:DNA-binding HxlR family transcriptional regulator